MLTRAMFATRVQELSSLKLPIYDVKCKSVNFFWIVSFFRFEAQICVSHGKYINNSGV